ncbi:MAG: sigma-70 family RNA polymerase sigma factor [Fuerstiella sp.]
MPDDDVELVRELRSGDESALGKLFCAYRPRLLRMVNFRMDKRLKRRLDVDDILQETWMGIAQRLPHFLKQPEAASCYVWMRLVTAQVMMDIYRRHLGTKARDAGRDFSLDQFQNRQATSESIANFFVARNTSPTQAAARTEATEQIRQVVAEMDPTDQEVLALRHYEELSNSEVAQVLEISTTAASTRYIRALKKLQEVMQRHPDLA